MLGRRCSGGVILGFPQLRVSSGRWKVGTPLETPLKGSATFPTPWNQLEAGILFALGLPLIVFREHGVQGGVFDNGVTDLFIHEIPIGKTSPAGRKALREILRKWAARVQSHYYEEGR